jgi:hypothetical protein
VERLLPWWYDHLSTHNRYPICFADFGMSEKAKRWAAQRGRVVDVTCLPFKLQQVPTERQKRWSAWGKRLPALRSAWFKKPLACRQFPFAYNLWLDLDCQVLGSLSPLFHTLWMSEYEMALAPEADLPVPHPLSFGYTFSGEVTYNSGVIAFRRNAELVERWWQRVSSSNGEFLGDQDALSREIFVSGIPVLDLPGGYNWRRATQIDPAAVIVHYCAEQKSAIRAELHDWS